MHAPLPRSLGKYTLLRCLGEGGMGVVYQARDDRLERDVAIKMISGLSDERSVKRFWREARAAAAVSHPNVCQIYEVDESPEGIFLAMELLAGEPLDARLKRSPCSPADAVRIGTEMLAALGALHERSLVHRDVKPSNVFLTMHGVKLLDFGLARSISEETVQIDGSDAITRAGMVVGTPRYMAPEQVRGEVVDGRTDIYATGAVLFELLSGRPAFASDNVFSLAHAVLNENPPALQGSAAVVAIDRVIRRAMAKDPQARHPTAEAMAADLRAVQLSGSQAASVTTARALLRIVVTPLRMSSEDSDSGFLSYGLAEAISGSLASLRDIVVRSPAVAAKWNSGELDPRRFAAEADIDLVVAGSLARMGDQLRATMQLVEAATGTVLGATSVRGTMAEIFAFEDELARGVVNLLTPMRASTSGGSGGVAAQQDVPANAKAFEHFLRGLEQARTMSRLPEARASFERALEEDPAFAPAWAWVGRCHRVIGKYMEHYEENDRRAEEAFRRALALSPDLPVAHRFFTHYESEHGRADSAIARLLQHARANRNDAQLFAALCHCLRYAGLLDASLAAHEEARRLDPTVPTSAEYTLLLKGDLERLRTLPQGSDGFGAHLYLLLFSGRIPEAQQILKNTDLSSLPAGFRDMMMAVNLADSSPRETLMAMARAMSIGAEHDPEAVFLAGMSAAHLGDLDAAERHLVQSVRAGFCVPSALEGPAVLAPLRERSGFRDAMEQAVQRQRIALAIFERGEGPSLLGIRS